MSPARAGSTRLLQSFWMGGYEGADHVNGAGEALDLVHATGHDERLDADYRHARRLGMLCVRESIGWRLSEGPGCEWDLSRAVRMAQAAQRQGIQILWTVMHYGLPADLTLLDDAMVPRFARFATEVARVLRPLCEGPRFYTPINEISFLSWAASATHDMGPAGMQLQGVMEDSLISGYAIKRRLVRAALAAMAAIRKVDPQARFLHVEPVVHVAPQRDEPSQRDIAQRISSYQWQTLDMLGGRMDPQLGGHPDALDWLGVNHYHSSQWEVPGEKRLAWHLRDPRRQPLSVLLHEVWRRYRRPLIVAETGHFGVGRAAWLHEIAGEAVRARALGVQLEGVCLYPLLDRPDWNETWRWHRSGLWHVPLLPPAPVPDAAAPGAPTAAVPVKPRRRLNRPYARALLSWRSLNTPPSFKPQAPLVAEEPGLLLLLPCAWEVWPLPRQLLLDALSARCKVRLLEPPRPSTSDPLLRRHTLAPGADLLVLHGRGAANWADSPTPEQLTLLRDALHQDGHRLWLCWLAGWRGDGHPTWWRELAGGGIVVQPDAVHPPSAELMRHAHAQLPAGWPGLVCLPRRPAPLSFEEEEIGRLLYGIPSPRVWLMAPQQLVGSRNPLMLAKLSRCMQAAARRLPEVQIVIDAPEQPGSEPHPPNLHWVGWVHDSLHAGLAAYVQGVMRWDDPPGWADGDGADDTHRAIRSGHDHALRPEQLAEMVHRTLQPVFQRHLGAPVEQ